MHRDGHTTVEHRGLDPQPPVSRWLLRRQSEQDRVDAGLPPCEDGEQRGHEATVNRWLLRAARGLKLVRPHHQPWQVAVAIAAGASVGLLPPGSLLFILSLLAVCSLPIHRGASIVVALGVAVSLPDVTTILDRVGWWSLTHPAAERLWLRIERLPCAAWLSLNHTVVNGGLIMACIAFLPSLALALPLARRLNAWASRATTWSSSSRRSNGISNRVDDLTVEEPRMASSKSTDIKSLTRMHAGVEELPPDEGSIPEEQRKTSQGMVYQEFPLDPPPAPPVIKPEMPAETGATTKALPSLEPKASIERLEVLLDRAEVGHRRALDTQGVLERAAEMTSLIDDILAQYEPSPSAAEHFDQGDATREIIRHDPQALLAPPPLNNLQTGDPPVLVPQRLESSPVNPSADTSVACSAEASPGKILPIAGKTIAHGADTSTNQCDLGLAAIEEDAEASGRATPLATTQVPLHSMEQHDEALHHLLNHLRELKEKA